jgi:hypothetical protein
MIPRARFARGAVLAGVGLFGVVVGHGIDYALLSGPAAARYALLARTGHGYLPAATIATCAAAVVAAVVAVGLGIASTRDPASGRLNAPPDWMQLAMAQMSAFVLLESVERLVVGGSLREMLGPLLVIGVLVQFVVGALGAVVVAALFRIGEVVGAMRAPLPVPGPPRSLSPARPRRLPARRAPLAVGVRAPPVPTSR